MLRTSWVVAKQQNSSSTSAATFQLFLLCCWLVEVFITGCGTKCPQFKIVEILSRCFVTFERSTSAFFFLLQRHHRNPHALHKLRVEELLSSHNEKQKYSHPYVVVPLGPRRHSMVCVVPHTRRISLRLLSPHQPQEKMTAMVSPMLLQGSLGSRNVPATVPLRKIR